jgi:hypothetical protein
MCVWWSHHARLKNTDSGLRCNPKVSSMDTFIPDVYDEMMMNIKCYTILVVGMEAWMSMGLHSNPASTLPPIV